MTFTEFDDLKYYGCFTATNKSGRTVTLDEDDLDNLWFYDSGNDIEYDGDCQLSGLTFVADDDAKDGTLTLKVSLVGEKSRDTVDGTLEIDVDGSGSSSDTISYTVKAGDYVDFDADDFYELFKENYSSSRYSLNYVIFDRPASSAFSNGTLYYNYGRSSEESFTRSSLSSATFYYDTDYMPDNDDTAYPLSKLTFVADRSFSGSIELTFRAYYSSNKYVDGTVVIAPESAPIASIAVCDVLYQTTSTVYGYSSGTWTISQLRFVPAAGFTGSVEIPYAICDSSGKSLGVGKFCLGVVNSQKKFSDVTASAWCYLYGVDVVQACAQMAYADVSTTLRIYTHLDAIRKRKSVDKLDAYLEEKKA